jgi:hypothetical protein
VATLTPDAVPARVCALSADARAAVLLDAAGAPVSCSEPDPARAGELGELARELMDAVDDAPGDPVQDVEVQVPGGTVYASRTPSWTLAVVARRAALSSLMLWDLRAVLGELEGGPAVRRATAPAGASASDDAAAGA